MAKRVTVKLRNPGSSASSKPVGTLSVIGRSKKQAKSKAKSLLRRLFGKNVAEGHYEGGVFHPHRSSPDYSRARAGEGRSKAAKKVRARQTVRKHGRKARRTRRGAIS